MTQPEMTGISHIALNVRDVKASVRWYGDVLGFAPVFPFDTEDFERVVMLHPSGAAVALTRHHHPDADVHFSERRTGLDHLAFAVRTQEDLDGWIARLDQAGVRHSGVSVTPETGSALIAFRDPDGIQLELYVQIGVPASMS